MQYSQFVHNYQLHIIAYGTLYTVYFIIRGGSKCKTKRKEQKICRTCRSISNVIQLTSDFKMLLFPVILLPTPISHTSFHFLCLPRYLCGGLPLLAWHTQTHTAAELLWYNVTAILCYGPSTRMSTFKVLFSPIHLRYTCFTYPQAAFSRIIRLFSHYILACST